MSRGERAYRNAVRAFSVVFVAIGIVILVVTAVNGGGSVGFLLGLLFVAIGCTRFWLASRSGS